MKHCKVNKQKTSAAAGKRYRNRVTIFILDDKGRVLVDMDEGRPNFPGGGTENGKLEAAVKREALEEAGYAVTDIKPLQVKPVVFDWPEDFAKKQRAKGRTHDGWRNAVRVARAKSKDDRIYNREGDGKKKLKFRSVSDLITHFEKELKDPARKAWRVMTRQMLDSLRELQGLAQKEAAFRLNPFGAYRDVRQSEQSMRDLATRVAGHEAALDTLEKAKLGLRGMLPPDLDERGRIIGPNSSGRFDAWVQGRREGIQEQLAETSQRWAAEERRLPELKKDLRHTALGYGTLGAAGLGYGAYTATRPNEDVEEKEAAFRLNPLAPVQEFRSAGKAIKNTDSKLQEIQHAIDRAHHMKTDYTAQLEEALQNGSDSAVIDDLQRLRGDMWPRQEALHDSYAAAHQASERAHAMRQQAPRDMAHTALGYGALGAAGLGAGAYSAIQAAKTPREEKEAAFYWDPRKPWRATRDHSAEVLRLTGRLSDVASERARAGAVNRHVYDLYDVHRDVSARTPAIEELGRKLEAQQRREDGLGMQQRILEEAWERAERQRSAATKDLVDTATGYGMGALGVGAVAAVGNEAVQRATKDAAVRLHPLKPIGEFAEQARNLREHAITDARMTDLLPSTAEALRDLRAAQASLPQRLPEPGSDLDTLGDAIAKARTRLRETMDTRDIARAQVPVAAKAKQQALKDSWHTLGAYGAGALGLNYLADQVPDGPLDDDE